MVLSILIPSTYDRQQMLDELISSLNSQIELSDVKDIVEIITEIDSKELPTGTKRNILLKRANGEYVVFIDSDDLVSDDYVSQILNALKEKPDVIGNYGWMSTNGGNRENFRISKDLPYITLTDAHGKNEYLRFNNHLSPVKREIALQIGFKDIYVQEDYDYAVRLRNSGLITTEVFINSFLYHYRFVSKK